MLGRPVSRLFCSARQRATQSRKDILIKVGAVGLAAGAGSLLYDTLSNLNMKKLSDTVDFEQTWDEEWDRYVRVPPELREDIKEWFIAPDYDLVKQREQFDEEQEIGVREIIMVRHGQYETASGDQFGHLTALGQDQAKATAQRLAELLKGKNVRCIFHSDMPRAKETAEAVAKLFPDVPVVETHLLAEAIPAEPNPPSPVCPAVVPTEAQRLEKAYRTFFARPMGEGANESVDVLIGHGNCFRFFISRAIQIDPRFWLRMAIFNCGISRVEVDGNGMVSLRAMGDVGHLKPTAITYS